MAKKTGLQKYKSFAKKYEKATGKKPVGMKLADLEEFFKKKRKKKTTSKSQSKSSGTLNAFRDGWQ